MERGVGHHRASGIALLLVGLVVAVLAPTLIIAPPASAESTFPGVKVSDVSIVEGDAGAQFVTFVVRVAAPRSTQFTVDYGGHDGTAVFPSDYSPAGGRMVFRPGDVSHFITMVVYGDHLAEPAESFQMRLYNPVGITIDDAVGVATVLDDDANPVLPTLSLSRATVHEGDGALAPATVTARLSRPVTSPVTADVRTLDGTALASEDYVPVSATLVIEPGQISTSIDVSVRGDRRFEGADPCLAACTHVEQLQLVASNVVGADLVGNGRITITDDDTMPLPAAGDPTRAVRTLGVGDALVHEGDIGKQAAVVTVRLDRKADAPVTVDWRTADGTATADSYVPAQGSLSFAVGEVYKRISVFVRADGEGEERSARDRSFNVVLSNARGATPTDATGSVTVRYADVLSLETAAVDVTEGDAGTMLVGVAVNLSAPPETAIDFAYETRDAGATAGSDYTAQRGTIRFDPGVPRAIVTIPVLGDRVDEASESIDLVFTNVTVGGTVTANRSRAVTIIDN